MALSLFIALYSLIGAIFLFVDGKFFWFMDYETTVCAFYVGRG
jgi:hypothetical protein